MESKSENLDDLIKKEMEIEEEEKTSIENHQVYHLIAKHLLLGNDFKIETLIQKQRRLAKINDYLTKKIEPGSEIEVTTTFKLTNEDFNFIDAKDWKKRRSSLHTKDYASMLLPDEKTGKCLTVKQVLDLRIQEQQTWVFEQLMVKKARRKTLASVF